jgi:hypothetical protein
VIKIRYSDLPAGLHVRTAVQGRHTILYLLPGLTAAQRRAALRRARSNARVGYGPRLPTAEIALALSADRIRTTARNSFAAARIHPALFVPATIGVASVAVTYVLLSTVSIQFRPPEAGAPRGQVGIPFGTTTGNSLTGTPARGSQHASAASAGRPAAEGPDGVEPKRGGGPHPGPGSRAHPAPFSSASPAPTVPGPSAGPSPGPSGGPSPMPSSSPSPALSGLCVDVGCRPGG